MSQMNALLIIIFILYTGDMYRTLSGKRINNTV